MRAPTQNESITLLAVVGSLILLNVLSVRTFFRKDVTRGGVYTLSKASRDSVSALEDQVIVSAYFTENLPPPYSSNARYVRDLLEEYRAASKGKVSFEFSDPAAQETQEDKEKKKEVKQDIFGRRFRDQTSIERDLAQSGIQPVEIRVVEEDQMQTKRAYMGLVIKYQEKKEVIPVVQDVRSLEYDLTTLIRKLTRTKAPVLGILQGHEEPKLDEKFRRLQVLFSQLYDVRPIEIGSKERLDADVDGLFVLGPKTPLRPNELKAIDQFLMKGKSAAFFLDSIQVDLRSFEPTNTDHGLSALLATYGVTVGDQLVADAQSGQLSVQERRGNMLISMPVPYPFIPQPRQLQSDSPVTNGIAGVTFPFMTALTLNALEGTQASVLARSSKQSWLEGKPYNIDPRRDWRSETITANGPHNLMVQVSGKLPSHYKAEASTSSGPDPILAESQGDARVVVAGGSSLAWDDFMGQPNQALLLNTADWLLLDPALLAMRTRGISEATLQPEIADSTRNLVKFGNILGVPLLLVAFGIVRWRMREARRATVTV